MKRILLVCFGFFFLSAFQSVYADGTSGCGLGTQIWSGNKGMAYHLMAVTTNGVAFGTTSQTSGTMSGCDTTKAVQREDIQKIYLSVNYDNLMEDASQGNGLYLATYAGLFNCGSENVARFSTVTKASFSTLFYGEETAEGILKNTKEMIGNDDVLSKKCSI